MSSYCILASGKTLSLFILLQLNVQRHLTSVGVLPLLGEPFNGQLETEDGGQEDREEREKNQEKEDSRIEAPEVFTSESTQTFPVRHPERFPSHRPDNLVPPAPQHPRRNRDHNWKQLGTTECSTTCGKGKPVWKSQARQLRERCLAAGAALTCMTHLRDGSLMWHTGLEVPKVTLSHPVVRLKDSEISAPTRLSQ